MKTTYLLVLLFFVTIINVSAQKPKKTHNYEKFAKKFATYSITSVEWLLGNQKDKEYISSKTGQSVNEITEANKETYKKIKSKIDRLHTIGLYLICDKAELNITQETPIKTADIKIFSHTRDDKFTVTLKNCMQTNLTWVLGDDIVAEGEIIDKKQKIQDSISTDNVVVEEKIIIQKGYHAKLYFSKKLVGKPLKGFYITTAGKKVDAVILNDIPSNMHSNSSNLILYKKGYNEQGFTSDDSNFAKKLSKNDVKAFMVGKYLYINENNSWYILLDEGAIKKLALVSSQPITKDPASIEKTDLIGKPVRGYYTDYNGKKNDVVIKYQEVEKLQDMTSTFLLYNIAYNEKGFTVDETNNFKSILLKSQVKSFNLAGITYYKLNGKWVVQTDEKNYPISKYISKIGKTPKSRDMIQLRFKKYMSDITDDYTELSTKIKNKEKGYKYANLDEIIIEYNSWYQKQYPDKIQYILADIQDIKTNK